MAGAAVLVLNCGSSSIKYQLVDVTSGDRYARGLIERIGEDAGRLTHNGARGRAVARRGSRHGGGRSPFHRRGGGERRGGPCRALAGLERLGIAMDPARNAAEQAGPRVISSEDSEVAVLVVPTDEELEIARQAADAVDQV